MRVVAAGAVLGSRHDEAVCAVLAAPALALAGSDGLLLRGDGGLAILLVERLADRSADDARRRRRRRRGDRRRGGRAGGRRRVAAAQARRPRRRLDRQIGHIARMIDKFRSANFRRGCSSCKIKARLSKSRQAQFARRPPAGTVVKFQRSRHRPPRDRRRWRGRAPSRAWFRRAVDRAPSPPRADAARGRGRRRRSSRAARVRSAPSVAGLKPHGDDDLLFAHLPALSRRLPIISSRSCRSPRKRGLRVRLRRKCTPLSP